MGARRVFTIVAGVVLGLATLQFFLAGIGVFGESRDFGAHELVGRITQVAALVLLLVAAIGRLGRSALIFGGGLFVIALVMGLLAESYGEGSGVVGAFHPLLAIALWFGAFQAFSWGRTGEPLVQSPATAHEH